MYRALPVLFSAFALLAGCASSERFQGGQVWQESLDEWELKRLAEHGPWECEGHKTMVRDSTGKRSSGEYVDSESRSFLLLGQVGAHASNYRTTWELSGRGKKRTLTLTTEPPREDQSALVRTYRVKRMNRRRLVLVEQVGNLEIYSYYRRPNQPAEASTTASRR